MACAILSLSLFFYIGRVAKITEINPDTVRLMSAALLAMGFLLWFCARSLTDYLSNSWSAIEGWVTLRYWEDEEYENVSYLSTYFSLLVLTPLYLRQSYKALRLFFRQPASSITTKDPRHWGSVLRTNPVRLLSFFCVVSAVGVGIYLTFDSLAVTMWGTPLVTLCVLVGRMIYHRVRTRGLREKLQEMGDAIETDVMHELDAVRSGWIWSDDVFCTAIVLADDAGIYLYRPLSFSILIPWARVKWVQHARPDDAYYLGLGTTAKPEDELWMSWSPELDECIPRDTVEIIRERLI